MIEVVHVEALGASLSLCRSESGGWKQNGRVLPWCGVAGHGHPGLTGFKLFAGDWMLGLYALRGRALSRAVVGLRALAGRAAGYLAVLALLVLLYLAASGCAEDEEQVAAPAFTWRTTSAPSEAMRRAACVCNGWGDDRHPATWRNRCISANCGLGAPEGFDPLLDDALARR